MHVKHFRIGMGEMILGQEARRSQIQGEKNGVRTLGKGVNWKIGVKCKNVRGN